MQTFWEKWSRRGAKWIKLHLYVNTEELKTVKREIMHNRNLKICKIQFQFTCV